MARLLLDVRQAAYALGTTEDAVRKRIQRGTLEGEHVDGEVYVWLDTDWNEQPNAVLEAKNETITELGKQLDFVRRELERKDSNFRMLLIIEMMRSRRQLEDDTPPSETNAAQQDDAHTPTGANGAQPDARGTSPSLDKPRQGQAGVVVSVGLSVLSAATLPLTLTTVALGFIGAAQMRITVTAAVLLYLICHVLPLFCGIWAGLTWHGNHIRGLILLGLLAGFLEIVTFTLYYAFPAIPAAISDGRVVFEWTPISDVAAVFATITLFASGGVFGAFIEWMRSPRGTPPSAWTALLIQATGGAAIGLIGTIITTVSNVLGIG